MIYRLLVACFKDYAFILHQITAWERVCRAAPNAELCPGAFRAFARPCWLEPSLKE